jgi:hypothetical protein
MWRSFETTMQLIIDCVGYKVWSRYSNLRNNNKRCRPVPGRPFDIDDAPVFILVQIVLFFDPRQFWGQKIRFLS